MSEYDNASAMPRAVIILADLYPTPGETPPVAGIPRLPVLEHWLARSQRTLRDSEDWRKWLREHLGADLRRATDVPGYWLATPVHGVAGLDTVRLHGMGLLRLDRADQCRLAEDFELAFAGSGWQLTATDARELLLRGPELDADAPDPARYLGQSVREAQLQGAQAAPLRRLQAEIEMWLHGAGFHGQSAGQRLKVTGLWLWGHEFAGPLTPRGQAYALRRAGVIGGRLYADDLAASACAAAVGLTQSGLPDAWPQEARADLDRYVVLNLQGQAIPAQLADIEQRWLQPALRRRQAGQYRVVELVCGARHWIVDSLSGWRFWRRRRHWLPELLAC
jgi:hypothetical protein